MATQKKQEETIELTPQQEKSLELIGNLYRQAVYFGNDLSEVLDIFISSLSKQDDEMCQIIVSEFIRYKNVISNHKFIRTLRSQINDLHSMIMRFLPKNMKVTIVCRRKGFESTVKKVLLYYLEGNSIDLADLLAFRIINDSLSPEKTNEEYCYSIHTICTEYFLKKKQYTLCKPTKQIGSNPLIKDYIEMPKENGYKSIHTALKTPDNNLFEFQIRTLKMHEDAEVGKAAHNEYKNEKYQAIEKHIWFDPTKVHIPNFRFFCNGSIYDKIGLKKSMHIEETSSSN